MKWKLWLYYKHSPVISHLSTAEKNHTKENQDILQKTLSNSSDSRSSSFGYNPEVFKYAISISIKKIKALKCFDSLFEKFEEKNCQKKIL